MNAARVIASFSAVLTSLVAVIAFWLASRAGSTDRSVLWYVVASAVFVLLTVVFIRAAILGKLPKWFQSFLDAQ